MAVAFATVFLRGLISVVTIYNAKSCKSVKLRNNLPKLKTGEHCRSILSGVEVAGFEPAAFWSRIKDFVRYSGFCWKLPIFRVIQTFSLHFIPAKYLISANYKVANPLCNLQGCSIHIHTRSTNHRVFITMPVHKLRRTIDASIQPCNHAMVYLRIRKKLLIMKRFKHRAFQQCGIKKP